MVKRIPQSLVFCGFVPLSNPFKQQKSINYLAKFNRIITELNLDSENFNEVKIFFYTSK